MYITRHIEKELKDSLQPNTVVVVYGPRQVGKTTTVKRLVKSFHKPTLMVSGEDRDVQPWLGSESITTLKQHIKKDSLFVVDEAQKVSNIGLNLKLIVDHIEGVRVLVTGSSSFEIANQVGEPLVGRQKTFILYPIAQMELKAQEALHETEALLPARLIYGGYPKVVTTENVGEKREILESLVDNYLFRDLLIFNDLKKSQKVIDILKLIAFQIGQEVSLSEIGKGVQLDSRTVEKYLNLLEKVFVIRRIQGFSRNLRKEVTKTSRYYFYDNGIRNAIVNNFNDLSTRQDVGQIWENYIVMERLKKQEYTRIYANNYFWRTWDQKEIDWVEERDGKLFGYEIKWNKTVKGAPKDWVETYPEAEFKCINKDNYLDFISE